MAAIKQETEKREVVCPFDNPKTKEKCQTTITFILTEDQINRGIVNVICPRCNGSIFFEIYQLNGQLRLDGPKALSLF